MLHSNRGMTWIRGDVFCLSALHLREGEPGLGVLEGARLSHFYFDNLMNGVRGWGWGGLSRATQKASSSQCFNFRMEEGGIHAAAKWIPVYFCSSFIVRAKQFLLFIPWHPMFSSCINIVVLSDCWQPIRWEEKRTKQVKGYAAAKLWNAEWQWANSSQLSFRCQ